MSDIVFEVLKCVVMIAALVVARYIVPWIKSAIEANNLDVVGTWVMNSVLKAQQVFSTSTGVEKKALVLEFLKELLKEKNLTITDEQLDALIEAAVKSMKIQEGEVADNEDVTSE